jgi:hypothetical protein
MVSDGIFNKDRQKKLAKNSKKKPEKDILVSFLMLKAGMPCFWVQEWQLWVHTVVIWGKFYEVVQDGRQIFESPQEVHKRGELKIKW